MNEWVLLVVIVVVVVIALFYYLVSESLSAGELKVNGRIVYQENLSLQKMDAMNQILLATIKKNTADLSVGDKLRQWSSNIVVKGLEYSMPPALYGEGYAALGDPRQRGESWSFFIEIFNLLTMNVKDWDQVLNKGKSLSLFVRKYSTMISDRHAELIRALDALIMCETIDGVVNLKNSIMSLI